LTERLQLIVDERHRLMLDMTPGMLDSSARRSSPWPQPETGGREKSVVEQRDAAVLEVMRDSLTVAEVAKRYIASRQTIYIS
jgi:hypothetical protein